MDPFWLFQKPIFGSDFCFYYRIFHGDLHFFSTYLRDMLGIWSHFQAFHYVLYYRVCNPCSVISVLFFEHRLRQKISHSFARRMSWHLYKVWSRRLRVFKLRVWGLQKTRIGQKPSSAESARVWNRRLRSPTKTISKSRTQWKGHGSSTFIVKLSCTCAWRTR